MSPDQLTDMSDADLRSAAEQCHARADGDGEPHRNPEFVRYLADSFNSELARRRLAARIGDA